MTYADYDMPSREHFAGWRQRAAEAGYKPVSDPKIKYESAFGPHPARSVCTGLVIDKDVPVPPNYLPEQGSPTPFIWDDESPVESTGDSV